MKDRQKIDKNFERNGMKTGHTVSNPDGDWVLLDVGQAGLAMFENQATKQRQHYSLLKTPVTSHTPLEDMKELEP